MKQMNKIYTGLGLSTSLICCTLIPQTFPIAYAANGNEAAVVLSANENSTENTGGTTDPDTGGNTGGTTDPGTGGNTGGTTDPGTGGNTGGTTDPGTGGNTGGTTDPGTGGNTGGTTDPDTGGNTGGTTDPDTEGNTTTSNIGGGVVVPNTQKPINSNVSEQAGIPTSNNEQQNISTSEGHTPVDQTSLLPKTGGEKTNAFELSLLPSVTSVIFTIMVRMKMKKGGDVQ